MAGAIPEPRCALTSPDGHAIPPHPGPASTFSLTGSCRSGISMTVSSAGLVVGARDGARASKEGKAASESVEDTERGESGGIAMVMGGSLGYENSACGNA